MGNNSIQALEKKHFDFLKKVYDESKPKGCRLTVPELAKALDFDQKTTDDVLDYLINEGLIEDVMLRQTIKITHKGKKEITANLQQLRKAFLEQVYKESQASTTREVSVEEVSKALELDKSTVRGIKEYLKGEGLIKDFSKRSILITTEGINAVETPDQVTSHFPSTITNNNTTIIGDSNNVQQGNNHSIQQIDYHSSIDQELRNKVDELLELIQQINLPEEEQAEMHAELATITAQMQSPKPKSTILQVTFQSISGILGGIVGNLLTPSASKALKKAISILLSIQELIGKIPF